MPSFRSALRHLICLLLLLANISYAERAVKITGFRSWLSPEALRLVFDLDKKLPQHSIVFLENPDRLVIKLEHVELNTRLLSSDLPNSYIQGVNYSFAGQGKKKNDNLTIIFYLNRKLKAKSEVLPPNEQYNYRLVVDLAERNKDVNTPSITYTPQEQSKKFVVVIDPGHGGDDPGALGHNKTREKDVTLAVARELQALFARHPKFAAYLTRDGDYYVGLRKRNNIARKHHADLLISVHADGFYNKRSHGASVFVLSERGASSEAARWLAKNQNHADLIGGVNLDDKDEVVASVLLDLSRRATQNTSFNIAQKVLKALGRMSTLHTKQVENASFLVLKSPDIPAILVETGFISHPATENKLRDRKYQKQLAEAIYRGVEQSLL